MDSLVLELAALKPVVSFTPAEADSTSVHQENQAEAAKDPGEDGGTFILSDIIDGIDKEDAILGGAAGAAALGAAGLAGAGRKGGRRKKDEKEEKKKQNKYKMYVQKDFGDAIRRGGAQPVKIRARIAEVTDSGAERDRNDLTEQIGVSGDGMTVHSAALVGRFCEATVSVPADNQNDTASITFSFIGEGGSFTNTVRFRLSDGPKLRFAEELPAGSGQLSRGQNDCSISAIHGDGFTYTQLFAVDDAAVPPEIGDLSAVNAAGFDVSFEKTKWPYVYRLIVRNNTPAQRTDDIFAQPEEKQFEIQVRVKDEQEPLSGYVTVCLYREGLTVQSRYREDKNGIEYVRVQSYEKEHIGGLDNKWQVTEMQFTLAVRGEDRALIDPEGMALRFEKLKGAGGKGSRADIEASLAEKYVYSEKQYLFNGKQTYTFEPNTTLYEPTDGTFYLVLLPVICEYKGEQYTAEVPLRLLGLPFDPMAGWEEEHAKLKERVAKFSIADNRDYWLQKIEDLTEEPRCSVEELRLTSKYLIQQYMRYWTVESMKYRDEAEIYDVIVNYLEWAKFFGDCAFSFLVNIYAGPVADAIISPAKDFLTSAIGETTAAWVRGESVDFEKFEFSKNVFAIGENLISNEISFTNWRQTAWVLGVYFAYASVKNFYLTLRDKNKFDLYGSIVKGFSDMTATALKAAAAHLFDAWLKNNQQFQKKVGKWCNDFVAKYLGQGRTFDLRNYPDCIDEITRGDILRKYLDGLFGMAIDALMEKTGDIHSELVQSMNGFEFDSQGNLIVTLYFTAFEREYEASINVTKAIWLTTGGLFAYLYDMIFGQIPSATGMIAPPVDPPLPPAKKQG